MQPVFRLVEYRWGAGFKSFFVGFVAAAGRQTMHNERGRSGAQTAMLMALGIGGCVTASRERIVAAMLMVLLRKQTTARPPRI